MHRLTISITPTQATQLDEFIAAKRYRNRSEGFREMIKVALASQATTAGDEDWCAAQLSFAFDCHQSSVAIQLATLYREQRHVVISSARHVMNDAVCVETVILRGSVANATAAATLILAVTGVRNGQLNIVPIDRI